MGRAPIPYGGWGRSVVDFYSTHSDTVESQRIQFARAYRFRKPIILLGLNSEASANQDWSFSHGTKM